MDALGHLRELFGSQKALALALGVGESAVSNWRLTGIPDAQKWRLLSICRERRLPLDLGLLGLEHETSRTDGDARAELPAPLPGAGPDQDNARPPRVDARCRENAGLSFTTEAA